MLNPMERRYRNTGMDNALGHGITADQRILLKNIYDNSFGLKSHLRPGHAGRFFYECGSYCSYEDLESTTTKEF